MPDLSRTPRRLGCQTYTWEMLGPKWRGTPDDLLEAIGSAGYSGIEITDTMIGDYRGKPDRFAQALDRHGLRLAAFAFASETGFTETAGFDLDLEAAKEWLDFLARFPGAVASMGSATVMDGGERDGKFSIAADIYGRIAELGQAAGVDVAVHPSSHHNTLLFDRADYDRLFGLLDPRVGWVPDTGHLLRGHADMSDTLRTHVDRIRYVHLKDVDANRDWAMLGSGICDTAAVLEICANAPNFNGWVVVEEESDEAGADPGAAVKRNREAMRRQFSL
jgi:inosose dehydratase